jgi:hypothetical protein
MGKARAGARRKGENVIRSALSAQKKAEAVIRLGL